MKQKQLIPKAQFGTGIVKRGLRWIERHMAPTQEQTSFTNQNRQRAELQKKKSRKRTLQDLQNDLNKLGYNVGLADNIMGRKTRRGIAAAEADGYVIDMNNFTIKGSKKVKQQQAYSLTLGDRITAKLESIFGSSKPDIERENKRLNNSRIDYSSREAYIQSKQQEARNRAASINISTATPTFPLGNYMVGHDFDFFGNTKDGKGSAKNMTEEQVRKLFTKYKNEAVNYLNLHPNIPKESKDQINKNIKYYDRVIRNPKTVSTKGSGIGFGCVYSATQPYNQSELSGNNVYANNKQLVDAIQRRQNTSYEILPWGSQLKIGDIIQVGTSKSKTGPHHAAMVTGFNTFGQPLVTQTNAGTAGIDDRDINSHSAYVRVVNRGNDDDDPNTPGIQPQGLQIIRFIGSDADRQRWQQEYESRFGKK